MTEKDNELRKRGLEYLMNQRHSDKRVFELNAREAAAALGITESSVYTHMDALVKTGDWKTRLAYDPSLHKTVKVWWLANESEE